MLLLLLFCLFLFVCEQVCLFVRLGVFCRFIFLVFVIVLVLGDFFLPSFLFGFCLFSEFCLFVV